MMQDLSVSQCVELINSNFEQTIPIISVIGELANFRISKGKWIYFDLKDKNSSIKFFGNTDNISQPVDDGMLLKIVCSPKLHSKYGFNLNVILMTPFGEGSIKKSVDLLKLKLEKEGIFDPLTKKSLPYIPQRIALIASMQSAAYGDFIKIIKHRWNNLEIDLKDVLVQGNDSIDQIIDAIEYFNLHFLKYDVLVVIRGGGSPEDLAIFNDEKLTRAIYNSKIATLVAIGHEIDVCLAELAADLRASTPSNAAELLVPDKNNMLIDLENKLINIDNLVEKNLNYYNSRIATLKQELNNILEQKIYNIKTILKNKKQTIEAYNPREVLKRGYSIVSRNNIIIRSTKLIKKGDELEIKLYSGKLDSIVKKVE